MKAIRKKRLFACFIVMLLFASSLYGVPMPKAAAGAAFDPGPELLANGGFEAITNGFPDQWELYDASYPLNVSTVYVYEGNYSLKLEDPSPAAQPGLRSMKIPITPGETYRASVFAHVSAQTGGPDLYLEFWDSAGARIQVDYKTAMPLDDWQKITIQKEAPANAAYATLLLYGSSTYEGTAYFDNASLVMIPKVDRGPELLSNGGFEALTNGAPDQWEQYDNNYPVFVSTYNAYEGNYSLKLEDPSPAAQVGIRSAKIPIVPGATFEASVYAYTHLTLSGGPDLYLEFWDQAGNRVQVDTKRALSSNDWQRISIQQTAPIDAAFATILLYGGSDYAGMAYFDNVSLTMSSAYVPNGGFEAHTNGFPDYWVQYDPNRPLSISTDYVYEGNYSLKLEVPSAGAQVGVRSAKVPVLPGKAYRASVFAYVADQAGADLYLEFWDSAGARIQVDTKTAVPVAEWQKLNIQQAAPANAAYATLLLYGGSTYVGVTYFDQATLTQIPLAELQQFMNNGFEEVVGGTPAYWNQYTPSVPAVSSTEHVYEGSHSVKLDNPNSYAMGLRSSKVPVTPGNNYRASVHNYVVSGSTEIYLEFWDSSGKRIAVYIQSGPLRNQWQPLIIEAEAPPDAAYATMLLLSNGVSVSYYDAAAIDPIPPEPVLTFPLQQSGHPRLYFTTADIPALRAKAQDTTANPFGLTGSQLWNDVKQRADAYLAETDHYMINYGGGTIVTFTLPPTQPGHIDPPPGYASYPFWTQMSKEIENRLESLSLAYVITGNTDYANKAKAYVLSMTTWNNWTDLEDECGGACLDTVHITMGMSAAYDMLYDLFTPAERSQIETALDTKALIPLYTNSLAKIDGNGPIVKATALAAGAAVLHGNNPNTNKYLTRAFNYMKWYLDQRMQSGQNEGFLYTDYSIDNLVKAIDQVTRTVGQNDLINHPYFNDFVVRLSNYMLAPGGVGMAAFSDSLAINYFHNTMNVLNNWLNNGFAGWYLSQAKPVSLEAINNFLYFNPNGPVTSPDVLPTSAVFPEIGWAALRSGWGKSDTLLAFQSNNFSAGHNHFDQNSFQIAANGSWIARDPGYQDFRPGAYHDFTVQMGHSTIQVDGHGQSSLGGGALTQGMITPSYDYVKGSAAGAYTNPKLTKYDRHIVYVKPNYYVMLDDLQADVPRNFDWVMFNGPLFDYRVDGTAAVPGQTRYGNDLYVQNGSAQISAKFLSEAPLPMTVTQYPGAEKYGYSVKVGSGDQKQTDYRFLTVMKAGPFEHTGYYQAEELLPVMTTSAASYDIRTEIGARFILLNMSQVGGYADYQINVDREGDYQFATTFIDHINFGNVQAYVDGQPIGAVFNAGDFGYKPATSQKHGVVHLAAGSHTLRYEAVGKNPDAAGYSFAIDAIQLAPVGEAVDAQMQIDASRLQSTNAIGARINRNDGSNITDTVLFKTGGSAYTLGGVGSDGEQTVVSRSNSGLYAGYAMTRGTTLTYNGNVLLQGTSGFSAAMSYDAQSVTLNGTIELSAPMSVALHAASVSLVSVDGVTLNANEYTYDAVAKVLTISLTAGSHDIVVSDLSGVMKAYQASGDLSNPMFKQLDNSLAQALHQLSKGSTEKAIKHLNDYIKHLNNVSMQHDVTAAAKTKLSDYVNKLIASWSKS